MNDKDTIELVKEEMSKLEAYHAQLLDETKKVIGKYEGLRELLTKLTGEGDEQNSANKAD